MGTSIGNEAGTEDQSGLDKLLEGWLDIIDANLSNTDTPLPDRPFQALLRLITHDVLEIHVYDQKVEFAAPEKHVAEPWFRFLYVTVERWYQTTYGADNVRAKGVPPLEGVILIRGAPYALPVPANRWKPHKVGREAWIYFEHGLGEGEDPVCWVKNAPDLFTLDSSSRSEVQTSATRVAASLRAIHFHRMGVTQDRAAEGLADAAKGYLESAARRIRTGRAEERGPAWFDLQMAMESALKLVLHRATDTYPHTHDLDHLLSEAANHKVNFDRERLRGWPAFKVVSNYRYAQGEPGGLVRLFDAYLLALDLVTAAMVTIETPLKSGAGFLLRHPPWLRDGNDGEEDNGSTGT